VHTYALTGTPTRCLEAARSSAEASGLTFPASEIADDGRP
jgi:hypothetical protein